MKQYTYLALGDAYTAGISIPPSESFPYQAVQLLRHRYPGFIAPEIIAGRGWATHELVAFIGKTRFLSAYDFVSLQIGSNNQTRGDSTEEFSMYFESLLLHAIRLAGNQTNRVIVLSIPDWSFTPYGASLRPDRPEMISVSARIDDYNRCKQELCKHYDVRFLDVTADLRNQKDDASLHSEDGLHPSVLAYRKWAQEIFRFIDDWIIRTRPGNDGFSASGEEPTADK
jgi:lysophospholipase L1-like esterase